VAWSKISVGRNGQTELAPHRTFALGDGQNLELRRPGEDLIRRGRVELGQVGIEKQPGAKLCCHARLAQVKDARQR
jgi:hypothetical protein